MTATLGTKPYDFSVVVPVYNEAGAVSQLAQEIKTVMKEIGGTSEILFINDGSTDTTLEVLKKIHGIHIINLNRNYGQATAFDAGFKAANGNVVISLDGDGQNDPHDIPKLLNVLQEKKVDVVAGWRKNRKDPRGIRILTRIGKMFRSLLIADVVHDSGCAIRVYKKEAIKSLDIGGEMHRYILALLRWKGFTIAEVEVHHRPRTSGKSKYTYSKAVRGFLDLLYIWFINKYSQRPLHLFGYISVMTFIGGIVSGGWSLYEKIVFGLSVNRNGWFFIGFFLILLSCVFFSIGIVIDLLVRLHLNNSPYEKRYYIREIISTDL